MIRENPAPPDRHALRAALELASRAPSVHNSQPWRWTTGPHTVHLRADLRHWLPVTDADGRDLVLSCGAALHHAQVALAAAGLTADVHRLPDPAEEDHLAAIDLRPGAPATADLDLAAAIPLRRTDRRRYSTWDIPTGFVDELIARAAEHGAVLRPVTSARAHLLRAIREADHTQEHTPGYRTETVRWTSGAVDGAGIPPANLLADPIGTGDGTARRFSTGTLDQDAGPEQDGALLVVIGTASDDTLSRLRAGEAASAVMLHATTLGLATCPLSQPLEVGRTRAVVRDQVLGGTLSPQLVIRIGWAPTGPAPPGGRHRRPAAGLTGPRYRVHEEAPTTEVVGASRRSAPGPQPASGRTTATGLWLCCSTAWLTEPRTSPARLPCPREPTTTSWASRERSTSARAGASRATTWLTCTSGYFCSQPPSRRSRIERAASSMAPGSTSRATWAS
jgi:nitroreductase